MSFYSFKNNFIYLLLAVLGFCCCMGFSLVAVCGLLIEVASLVVENGLESTGAVAVAHRLGCSAACGIFPDQGLNLCLLLGRQIVYH